MESLGGPSYTQCRSSELSEPTSSGFPSIWPSSSGSSRAESTDTATTEIPGSASEEEESDIVPSLLDKLEAPKPSDLARKWKIVANMPCGKRRSHGPCGAIGGSDLKTIQLEKHVTCERLPERTAYSFQQQAFLSWLSGGVVLKEHFRYLTRRLGIYKITLLRSTLKH